jgi:hypothetical protein
LKFKVPITNKVRNTIKLTIENVLSTHSHSHVLRRTKLVPIPLLFVLFFCLLSANVRVRRTYGFDSGLLAPRGLLAFWNWPAGRRPGRES